MPWVMESQGIQSYVNLVQSRDWGTKRNQGWLQRAVRSLEDRVPMRRWPNVDFDQGFRSMVSKALGQPFDALGIGGAGVTQHIMDEIRTEYDAREGEPGARSVFEKVARNVCNRHGLPEEAVKRIMWLGNETYHYNQAACFDGMAEEPSTGVYTRYSPAFTWMQEPFNEVSSPSSIYVPVLHPDHSIYLDGEKLRRLVKPGEEVFAIKAEYLQALDDVLAGQLYPEDMRTSAEVYARELRDLFSFNVNLGPFLGPLTTAVGPTLRMAGAVIGSSLGIAATSKWFPLLSPAGGAAGVYIASRMETAIPHIIRQFRYGKVQASEIPFFKGQSVMDAIGAAKVTASVLLDHEKSKKHVVEIGGLSEKSTERPGTRNA
jgi:hypothetical protein